MRTKKHHLILAAVVSILCALALGNVELPQEIEPGLIGQHNPALAGIQELYVVIEQPNSEPNKDGLVLKGLQSKVEHKLEKAGVKLFQTLDYRYESRSFHIPELKVCVDMLKLQDSQQYVSIIQTSLSRAVRLILRPEVARHLESGIVLRAAVWKVEPAMQVVPAQRMPAKVTEEVLEQIDAFVLAYIVANMEAAQTPDANDVGTTAKERILKPLPKPTPAKYNYVASKNSKVFHRPQCSFAGRIAPKNLVGYNSRADAIRAGKRPCKICKP